jgi:HSP20 family protein
MVFKNLPSLKRSERNDFWTSYQDDFRDLLNRFDELNVFPPMTPTQFIPRIDVRDNGSSYLVTAEIPGMTQKDINLSLDQNILTLEGEKKSEFEDNGKGFWRSEISYGSFYRAIPFNDELDVSKVEASYKDGVLKVNLVKKEGKKSKAKKIEINSKPQIQQ